MPPRMSPSLSSRDLLGCDGGDDFGDSGLETDMARSVAHEYCGLEDHHCATVFPPRLDTSLRERKNQVFISQTVSETSRGSSNFERSFPALRKARQNDSSRSAPKPYPLHLSIFQKKEKHTAEEFIW